MTKSIIAFFILINGCLVSAQTDTVKHRAIDTTKHNPSFYKNTISVNLSGSLARVIKPNATPDLNSAFLYYTRNFKNCFVRLGVNGWNTQNIQNNVQTNEQTVSNKFYSSASLGFYLTKNVGRKFSVAYGLNFLTAYVDSSTTFITSFDKVKNYATSVHYGVAPGVILKYKINKRLSVFAEYTLPVKMIISKTGTTYSLFPNENSTDRKTTNYSSQIYNPISIYISCSF
ncbi:MAG TPA: hypothetical protein VK835_13435 [Bacteroidia bacterium]|nr:hypothetical protein [Bacteroidia bacterium]